MEKNRFSTLENQSELCFLCLEKCAELCSKCSIPYCSEEHFRQHFNEELDYCYPFRVMQKPLVGRYLVSTRDLEPTDLILKDIPALKGLVYNRF